MGLYDLLAAARECLVEAPSLVSFTEENGEADLSTEDLEDEELEDLAATLADAVLARAWHGSFFKAGTTGYPWPQWLLPPRARDPWDDLDFDNCLPWQAFADACVLAERIDDFLAVFERDRASAALARGCRHDLDTLPILADWCEENGLPMAAREARHLRDQVRYLQQG